MKEGLAPWLRIALVVAVWVMFIPVLRLESYVSRRIQERLDRLSSEPSGTRQRIASLRDARLAAIGEQELAGELTQGEADERRRQARSKAREERHFWDRRSMELSALGFPYHTLFNPIIQWAAFVWGYGGICAGIAAFIRFLVYGPRLRRLGYREYRAGDVAWLALAHGARLRLAPPADELAILPGYDATPRRLAAFIKERAKGREWGRMALGMALLNLISSSVFAINEAYYTIFLEHPLSMAAATGFTTQHAICFAAGLVIMAASLAVGFAGYAMRPTDPWRLRMAMVVNAGSILVGSAVWRAVG